MGGNPLSIPRLEDPCPWIQGVPFQLAAGSLFSLPLPRPTLFDTKRGTHTTF